MKLNRLKLVKGLVSIFALSAGVAVFTLADGVSFAQGVRFGNEPENDAPVEGTSIFTFDVKNEEAVDKQVRAFYGIEPIKDENYAIAYSAYDFNEDGQEEIVAYFDLPQTCGSFGCRLSIFTQEPGGKLRLIQEMTGFDLLVLESRTSGYHDIQFFSGQSIDLYVWNGTQYAGETNQ